MKLERNFDILDNILQNYQKDFHLSVKRRGKWETFDAKQYKEYVDNFSIGLLEMGFQKGDKILTVSNNRPEWNFIDMGMGQIGVVHVPVYTNLTSEEHLYILEHSEAKMVIVSSAEFYLHMKPLTEKIDRV